MKLLRLAALAFALAGCPGPTFIGQQYNGAPRPREQIAIVRVNGNDSVRLIYLDNEDVAAPLEADSRLHIEVLPGMHTVGVRRVEGQSLVEMLTFFAEADHVYRVSGTPMHVFEVNRGSDAMVRDVTLEPAAPTPPPPMPPPPAEATPD